MRIYDYHLPADTAPLANAASIASAYGGAAAKARADQGLVSDHTALSTHGSVLLTSSQARAQRIEALTREVRGGQYSVPAGLISKGLVRESAGAVE